MMHTRSHGPPLPSAGDPDDTTDMPELVPRNEDDSDDEDDVTADVPSPPAELPPPSALTDSPATENRPLCPIQPLQM